MQVIESLAVSGKKEKEETLLTSTHVCQKGERWGFGRHESIPLHLLSSLEFRYAAPI